MIHSHLYIISVKWKYVEKFNLDISLQIAAEAVPSLAQASPTATAS